MYWYTCKSWQVDIRSIKLLPRLTRDLYVITLISGQNVKHSTRKLYTLSVIVFNAILRIYLPIRYSIRTAKCFFRTCPPISDRRSWKRGPFSSKMKQIKKKANLYSRFRCTQSKSYDRRRIVNLKKGPVKIHEDVAHQRIEQNFLRLISVKNDPRFQLQRP